MEEHDQEVTIDELTDLHRKQQQDVIKDISSDEEEKMEEFLTSNDIKGISKMWERVQNFFRKAPSK